MKSLFNICVNFLFPPKCVYCHDDIDGQSGLCALCWNKITFINYPYCYICGKSISIDPGIDNVICIDCHYTPKTFNHARALFKFDDYSKKIIHDIKYHNKINIIKVMAEILAQKYKDTLSDYEIIIPVPMHKFKRIFRGYNQAQIIAEKINLVLKKKVINDVLLKNRITKAQTELSKSDRLENVRGSFSVYNKHKIINKNIILVDDVMTTGSTLYSCAQELKSHGANNIFVFTIATT